MVVVTVTGAEATARREAGGHTRRLRWSGHVPNWEAREKEAELELLFILNGMVRLHELPAGDSANFMFMNAVQSYITRFFHRFTKETHTRLIRLLFYYATAKGQRGSTVNEAVITLKALISGSRLTRDDLELPWRPVYDLFYSTLYGKNDKVSSSVVTTLASLVKKFFPVDSTAAIWEELSLYRDYEKSVRFELLCQSFLPVTLTVEQHKTIGASIWWKAMWDRYERTEMNTKQQPCYLQILAKLQKNAPGFLDWRPYYDRLFSDVLRGLQFPTRGRGKALPEGAQESLLATVHTNLIIHTFGIENGCDEHLWKLFEYIGHELHPFHEDEHTITAIALLNQLCVDLVTRYRREYIKPKKDKLDPKFKLPDQKIRLFITKILPLLSPAFFSTFCTTMLPSILQNLAFFAPDLVLPRIIEHIHPSLQSQIAPARLPHLLALLSRLVLPITRTTLLLPEMPKDVAQIDEMGAVILPSYLTANSSRAHVIILLDEIVDLIDMTNMSRTVEICNLLHYIFMLTPVVDCSKLIEKRNNNLSDEERQLVELSAKLPDIVERATEKLLLMVEVLCTPVPVNSNEVFGSLSLAKDNVNHTSDEDLLIDCTLSLTFTSIANAGSPAIIKKIASRLMSLVLTGSHEHVNASRTYGTMISFLVTYTPENWTTIYEHIYKNLTKALDEKTRKQKQLPNYVLWYAQMVDAVCNVNSELIHKHEKEIFQLVSLLLSCTNPRMWKCGSKTLCIVIYRLLWPYPLNDEMRRKHKEEGLFSEEDAIKDWGHIDSEKTFTMTWHTTDANDVKAATRFLQLTFDAMKALEEPKTLSREDLEKNLWIVRASYEEIVWYLPKPPREGAPHSKVSTLPISQDCLPDPDPSKVILCPDGQQVTTRLLSVLEKLQKYLLTQREEEFDALQLISTTIVYICSPCSANMGEESNLSQLVSNYRLHIVHPITNEAARGYCEKVVFHEYMSCMVDKRAGEYDMIRDVAVRMLCLVATSRYNEVNSIGRSLLQQLCNTYRGAQITATRELTAMMQNQKIEDELMIPLLDTVLATGLSEAVLPDTRLAIWKSLLDIKHMHLAPAVDAYESLLNTSALGIQSNVSYLRPVPTIKYDEELTKLCKDWGANLARSPIWIEYEKKGGFSTALIKWNEHIEYCKKTHEAVIGLLKAAAINVDLLHNRRQWARKMLFYVQHKNQDLPTIQLMLGWLTHEMESTRIAAMGALVLYLQKHKPKRNTMIWNGPLRDQSLEADACGVLPHTAVMCYDSQDLPNTEEKWNKMVFVTRCFGYRFPKELTVTRPRNLGEPMERGALTDKEAVIVAYFENPNNINEIIRLLVIEKNQGGSCINFRDVALLWKYLLRNFPKNEKIYEITVATIKTLMAGKTKEQHSLALDLITGLIIGTRHRPFAQLEAMWAWLRPALTHFVETINSEAESNWNQMIRHVLSQNDWRRYWWLVELSVDLVQGTSFSTSRKFEVRFNTLPDVCPRRCSVFNRLITAAWKCCSMAFMDTDRATLSGALLVAAQLDTMCTYVQGKKELANVPTRLLPICFDNIIGDFLKQLHFVTSQPNTPSPIATSSLLELHKVNTTESAIQAIDLFTAILRLQGASPIRPIGSKRTASSTSLNTAVDASPQGSPNKKARLSGVAMESRSDTRIFEHPPKTPSNRSCRKLEDVSLIYLRILIDMVWSYYETQTRALSTPLMALIPPLLLLCSNDDEKGHDSGENAWADTRQKASSLVFDYMAACPVAEQYADAVLGLLEQTYSRSPLYRFKVSVLKYAQTTVLSNHYVYLKETRRDRVRKLVITAISDASIEVRKVAANVLISLLQASFLDASDPQLLGHFLQLCRDRDVGARESGCAGLCSLLMACPPGLQPRWTPAYTTFNQRYSELLFALCRLVHDPHHKIREYAGNCLRTFRASRRDEWAETRALLGTKIADAIENAGEPSYYA